MFASVCHFLGVLVLDCRWVVVVFRVQVRSRELAPGTVRQGVRGVRSPSCSRPLRQAGPGTASVFLPDSFPRRLRVRAEVAVPPPGSTSVPELSSAGQALRMAVAGLGWLASADAGSLPAGVQAEALRQLERILSLHAAARASVLAAFTARRGC